MGGAEETPAVELPASEEPAAAKSEEVPDWLADMGGAEETPAAEIPASEEPAEEAKTPAWLDSLPAIEETTLPESGTPALLPEEDTSLASEEVDEMLFGEMPDWLSMLAPEEKPSATSEGQPSAETEAENTEPENLEAAALPDWIQTMRPIEAVVPETPLDEAEDSYSPVEEGPLAGLSGILPAGPGIGQLSKPKPQTVKLDISDTQQTQAALLEQILAAETTPKAIPSPKEKPLSRLILRWSIAAVLLLVVGIATLLNTRLAPTPSMYPISVMDTLNIINALPENAPILVLVEYEPGVSGEIESAAAPVIGHTMLHGARIALLSTQPTGPALGERLIANWQGIYDYHSGEQYINLGYLPGYASGVQAFAANPPLSVPETMNGIPAWTTPALEGVHALDDFALILLLTGRPETAQMWIEQTHDALNGTPLLVVSSAQAAPVLEPYYVSGQVRGIVSGIDGGLAYESLNGRDGTNHAYWDAYSFGFLVAEIFILLGAVWGLLASRGSNSTGEEA
jgi:hypothetical protein